MKFVLVTNGVHTNSSEVKICDDGKMVFIYKLQFDKKTCEKNTVKNYVTTCVNMKAKQYVRKQKIAHVPS